MSTEHRPHHHSHRCRRHAAQAAEAAAAAAAARTPPKTWGAFVGFHVRHFAHLVAQGAALGAGTLLVSYLYGRYWTGSIPPGHITAHTATAGGLTGNVETTNVATGEKGSATVTITPRDVAAETIQGVAHGIAGSVTTGAASVPDIGTQ